MYVQRSARIRRANPTQEKFIIGDIYDNAEWGNVDWRTAFLEKIRRVKNMIRSLITNSKFETLVIPALLLGNTVLSDTIARAHPNSTYYMWAPTHLSSYINDLPPYPNVDQIVNYVAERILNGTYKLKLDNYVDNTIRYVIGGVRKTMFD
jgi:hypothetical protein